MCSRVSKSVYRVKLSCLSNLFRSTRGGFPYTRFDRIFARPFNSLRKSSFFFFSFFFEPFVALDRARYLAMQHTRNLCNTGFCILGLAYTRALLSLLPVTTAVAYLVVTWSKKPLDRVRNHVDENVYAFSNDSTIVQAHPS